jgi:hypothetical protein
MEKKEWATPELTIHGTVEIITAACTGSHKAYGASDGFAFDHPIVCTS